MDGIIDFRRNSMVVERNQTKEGVEAIVSESSNVFVGGRQDAMEVAIGSIDSRIRNSAQLTN